MAGLGFVLRGRGGIQMPSSSRILLHEPCALLVIRVLVLVLYIADAEGLEGPLHAHQVLGNLLLLLTTATKTILT